MISKFWIWIADIMIRIALHSVVVVYTLQLQHNSILYYYTVTEMHMFFVRSRLQSTGKSITCTQVSKSIDNDLDD